MNEGQQKLDAITDEALLAALPHGSGINGDWCIKRCKNGTIRCCNRYSLTNDVGYHSGYASFKVELFAHRADVRHNLIGPCAGQVQIVHRRHDIDFRVIGPSGHGALTDGLGDYIHEQCDHLLGEAGLVDRVSTETVPA